MKVTKTDTKYSDIKIGDIVEIISECVDFTFFREGVKGEVVKKNGEYLGVIVKFIYDDNKTFGFSADNLKIIKPTQPTTNNLEGWIEEFDKLEIFSAPIPKDLNGVSTFVVDISVVKQFISDLRQKDCEELIKMLEEISPAYDGEALDTNNNRRWYEQGFGEFKKEVINILSDLRSGK